LSISGDLKLLDNIIQSLNSEGQNNQSIEDVNDFNIFKRNLEIKNYGIYYNLYQDKKRRKKLLIFFKRTYLIYKSSKLNKDNMNNHIKNSMIEINITDKTGKSKFNRANEKMFFNKQTVKNKGNMDHKNDDDSFLNREEIIDKIFSERGDQTGIESPPILKENEIPSKLKNDFYKNNNVCNNYVKINLVDKKEESELKIKEKINLLEINSQPGINNLLYLVKLGGRKLFLMYYSGL